MELLALTELFILMVLVLAQIYAKNAILVVKHVMEAHLKAVLLAIQDFYIVPAKIHAQINVALMNTNLQIQVNA